MPCIVRGSSLQSRGAKILLEEMPDPQRFGVAGIGEGRLVGIEERPEVPASDLAVTEVYMYDRQVFDIVRTLQPSARGELEVTNVNNAYVDQGTMTHNVPDGWRTDAQPPKPGETN